MFLKLDPDSAKRAIRELTDKIRKHETSLAQAKDQLYVRRAEIIHSVR